MYLTLEKHAWLRQLAVAALYFIVYVVLRHASSSAWLLPAGLRLTCLLLMPYRYWAALVVGEMLGLGATAYECFDTLGPVYAGLSLIPPIAVEMPIVHWCRQRLSLFGTRRRIRMGVLMLCTLLVAVLSAAGDYFLMWIAPVPPGEQAITPEWAPRYFLGHYLGILTVVPLALLLWQVSREGTWRERWERLPDSRLVMDSAALLIPTLALLGWIAAHSAGSLNQAARFGMFLPVAALTLRHGWHGTAIGGAAASIAIALAMPVRYDPATLQAEVFMSFTITTLLMLGARITALHAYKEKERIGGRLALQVAQHGLYLGELRMQQAADTIEQIGASIHHAHERLFGRLRQLLPATEEHGFARQAMATQQEIFRLADGISPRAWAASGTAYALRQGAIAHAFDGAGVLYDCDIQGTDLSTFVPGTQLALYRLACEAAVYLHEQATLSAVRVTVRAGTSKRGRWVALRMDGVHVTDALDLMPTYVACEHFKDRLGATGQGVRAIHDQAHVYGGTVHVRSTAHGTRLALLLHDAETGPDRVN